jgi:hypothetical protein
LNGKRLPPAKLGRRARSRHRPACNPDGKALLLLGGIDWNRDGPVPGNSW